VNNSKLDDLFETLRGACSRQFCFNPRRVTSEMRYVGKEGHGKDQVHVFRDAKTHSQIVLKSTYATLRETQGDKPHWSESEMAHYKETDAEIDAMIQKKEADLEYAIKARSTCTAGNSCCHTTKIVQAIRLEVGRRARLPKR
jgi:hypothetical protein